MENPALLRHPLLRLSLLLFLFLELAGADDASALLAFKAAVTNDPLQRLSGWGQGNGGPCDSATCSSQSGCVSKWSSGIICDQAGPNGRVVTLNVQDSHMVGTLSPALGGLTALVELEISDNFFTGPIPAELANCTSLSIFNAYNNRLMGTIPTSFGTLTNLTHLGLGNNTLSGPLPASLGNAASLQFFDVYLNYGVSGPIPPEWAKLVNLQQIAVSHNQMSGPFPAFLTVCTKLQKLDLVNNSFYGALPTTALTSWGNLSILTLGRNNFTGPLPLELNQLTNLTIMGLGYLPLSGPIPNLGQLVKLTNVSMQRTRMTGPISSWMANWKSIQSLTLYDNAFGGAVPLFLGTLPNLVSLNLRNTSLTGAIPTELGKTTWQNLDLRNNNLTGTVPSALIGGSFACSDPDTKTGASFVAGVGAAACILPGNPALCLGACTTATSSPSPSSSSPSIGVIVAVVLVCLAALLAACLFLLICIHRRRRRSSAMRTLEEQKQAAGIVVDVAGSLLPGTGQPAHHATSTALPWLPGQHVPPSLWQLSASAKEPQGAGGGHVALQAISPASASQKDNELPTSSITSPANRQIMTVDRPRASPFEPGDIDRGSSVGGRSSGSHGWRHEGGPESNGFPTDGSSGLESRVSVNEAIFSLTELRSATEEFNPGNELGRGGFGIVYKGQLPNGTLIAVKRRHYRNRHGGNDGQLLAEIEAIRQARHRNLVSLLGFCTEGQEELLVYDYFPSGSLHQRLHSKKEDHIPLDWPTRLRIAQGAARGLAYLHHEIEPHIIHRDVKSSNVLLDKNNEACIIDFGLAKLVDADVTHLSTTIAGTAGYMAPEYVFGGRVTTSCDVYSFGVLLLEITSGRTAVESHGVDSVALLADTGKYLANRGKLVDLIDPAIASQKNNSTILAVMELAAKCVDRHPRLRPTMEEVSFQLRQSGQPAESTLSKEADLQYSGVMAMTFVGDDFVMDDR